MLGLTSFTVVYVAVAVSSDMNLGHRHLLPIYPPMLILCGRAVWWLRSRVGQWLVGAAVCLLVYANASIYPDYLAYFNELIGGPDQAHRYLVDSNLDWGQDLKRLAAYTRDHPERTIKLAYFGSADPQYYGVACEMMPSQLDFGGPPAELSGGTYVVSLTQLFGVYTRQVRDEFWARAINRQQYAALTHRLAQPASPDLTAEQAAERAYAQGRLEAARRWRLINRLKTRPPDERIGRTMFVFHLSQSEIDAYLSP